MAYTLKTPPITINTPITAKAYSRNGERSRSALQKMTYRYDNAHKLARRSTFTCLRDASALYCPVGTSCLAFAPSTWALIRAG